MTLFEFDPEIDVRIVCDAVGFLPNLGATRQHLETLNGIDCTPGTRFGNALDTAIERGLVRQVGNRYYLANKGAEPCAS